jgi:hypothetical protein
MVESTIKTADHRLAHTASAESTVKHAPFHRLARAMVLATVVAVGVFYWVMSGNAFTPCHFLPGATCASGHYSITIQALSLLPPDIQPSGNAVLRLAAANEQVDLSELNYVSTVQNGTWMPKTGTYNHSHHFDRPLNATSIGAFNDGLNYLHTQSRVAIDIFSAPDGCQNAGKGLDELGKVLHALQDAYSHSNYVDDVVPLPPADQSLFQLALQFQSLTLPSNLRMTVYDFPNANSSDAENPEGVCTNSDPTLSYCHRFWSKDFTGKNPNNVYPTPFTAAYNAAVIATAQFMQGYVVPAVDAVGAGTWARDVGNYGGSNACTPPPICPMCPGGGNGGGPGGGPTTLPGTVLIAGDPNNKVGSQGVGTQQYISGVIPLRYAVEFANQPTATAPAERVVVMDQINTGSADLSTLTVGPISVMNQVAVPPAGPGDFSATVDLRPASNLLVAINTHLDLATGVLTWTFQGLDPSTNRPPLDPAAGFLPPGAGGSLLFTVMPKQGLVTGTQIQNQATVVFDVNAPMNTPTWTNTLDNSPPTSRVVALPAIENSLNFLVQWSGTDVGAGVQDFTVYVSDNSGPYIAFQTSTAATSAIFSGQNGHAYAFYSIARDLVGNVEAAKTVAEATTEASVDTTPPTFVTFPTPITVPPSSAAGAVVNYTLPTATDSGSGVSPAGVSCVPLSGSAFVLGTTTVTCRVADNVGNVATGTFTVTVHYNFLWTIGKPAPALNSADAGDGYKIAFTLGGNFGLNVVSALTSTQVACSGTKGSGLPEAEGPLGLSYNSTSGNYQETFARPGKNALRTCTQINLVLNDGTSRAIDIKYAD